MTSTSLGPTPRLHAPGIALADPVQVWLFAIAALIFAMVVVGGATRLTDSGLSITEWQPLLGVIPPLTHEQWIVAFDQYRQIPQYQLVNKGMSLEAFQAIYWWEWAHRLLGRVIGLAFFVPLLAFWALGRVRRALLPRLALIFVLGGFQGALGWYMVQSGLTERVSVSQYRLAAHLTLACIIFTAVLWTALTYGRERSVASTPGRQGALVICGLILVQVALGGLVAGLDAGMGYNSWPLMDGALVPKGLFIMEPAWRNLFENAMTVQFNHRLMAYVLTVLVFVHVLRLLLKGQRGAGRVTALALIAGVLAQASLGIVTLLWQVPIGLALKHQAGAVLLLAVALWHLASLTHVRTEA